MRAKKEPCKVCGGKGKRLLYHNGTMISSEKCKACGGTGRVSRLMATAEDAAETDVLLRDLEKIRSSKDLDLISALARKCIKCIKDWDK